jgi:Dynamin family.
MEQGNIFSAYQEKKKRVIELAVAAQKNNWIDEQTLDEITTKLDQDKLTIGVIGQMKCGKSTFLNAFLFGQEVLPSATTPMTAALSVITYGEKKEIEAEFYTSDEWAELRAMANRTIDDVEETDVATRSSIKAAKELFEKSRKLGGDVSLLLGKTQKDDFNNLIEYVGADGEYVSIVKQVTIHLPEDWLKGVEIVDTPGFNDPVVSREVRTQDFLKRADVVLLMLYAGRAFDATDRDILFEKVRKVGVGKILIAANKYDLCLAEGESPEGIIENINIEISKALREYREDSLNELLGNLKPLIVSANMALMARMPMSRIESNPDLLHHYNQACNLFDDANQEVLLKKSRILELEDAVKDLISTSKEEILIRKPINLIFQNASNIIEDLKKTISSKNEKKKELEMPDTALEERIEGLQKAQRRIKRRIVRTEEDMSEGYDEEITKSVRKIEDEIRSTKNELERIISTEKGKSMQRKVENMINGFKDIDLPRMFEDCQKHLRSLLSDKVNEFVDDVQDLLEQYIEDSEDVQDAFKSAVKQSFRDSLMQTCITGRIL